MRVLLLLLGTLLLAGCERDHSSAAEAGAEPPEAAQAPLRLMVPAAAGSALPNLVTGDDGRLYLSWVEAADTLARLRYAELQDTTWTTPRDIAAGDDWFVNWADFPALAAGTHGPMAAHFLQRSGSDTYAYDVRLTLAAPDAGWRPAVTPHDDGTQTEHGFASLVPRPDGSLFLTWLDGRQYAGSSHGDPDAGHHAGPMTLRYAVYDADGGRTEQGLLDDAVCDCCQTAAVRTPGGMLVAYRDRSPEEVRDIYTVRLTEAGPSAPARVAADDWQINACPVNGPALAADGARVALAWFHAAHEVPTVQVAFSDDEGASFSPPIRVDDSRPLGRVDVVMLPDGAALVSWVEAAEDAALIRVRRVARDGQTGPGHTVAHTTTARAGGFPHLARDAHGVVAAWTVAAEPSQVQAARLPRAWLAP